MFNWATKVKIRDGYCCQRRGCGCFDRRLLHAHHIKSRKRYPHLAENVDNGITLCMYHHALRHGKETWAYTKIMAKLGEILYDWQSGKLKTA